VSQETKQTLVQCDFDGTITHADVSYMVLDTFADGDWRKLLAEYRAGRITVGEFNTRAFVMGAVAVLLAGISIASARRSSGSANSDTAL
jgi:hypothetical protein